MSNFVYTIYIAASSEKVWAGLTDPTLTQAYWDHHNVSSWEAGARWTHVRSSQSGKVDIVGRVVEVDPPCRLVLTWALPADQADETKHSLVRFELKTVGPDTKLTVIHSELEAESDMLRGVGMGWPATLSNLKTLLETGRTLSSEMWRSVEDYEDFGL
jgi:uncharacterized protein YndB with AHSA1/START domain